MTPCIGESVELCDSRTKAFPGCPSRGCSGLESWRKPPYHHSDSFFLKISFFPLFYWMSKSVVLYFFKIGFTVSMLQPIPGFGMFYLHPNESLLVFSFAGLSPSWAFAVRHRTCEMDPPPCVSAGRYTFFLLSRRFGTGTFPMDSWIGKNITLDTRNFFHFNPAQLDREGLEKKKVCLMVWEKPSISYRLLSTDNNESPSIPFLGTHVTSIKISSITHTVQKCL